MYPAWITSKSKGITVLYQLLKRDLAKVENLIRKELRHEYQYLEGISKHMMKFAGKRLRPGLLLYFANLTGNVKHSHIILAATIELLHSATLVHDDILDESTIRRNVSTLNEKYGNEEGVIYGDLIFSKVFTLCASLKNQECIDVLSETTGRICTGELLQLSQRSNLKITEQEYMKIIEFKTAALFETACRLGCIENVTDPKLIQGAKDFGKNLGIAFQIVDDCLDITGNENEIGKSLGTDVDRGKITLPCLELFKRSDRKQIKYLEELFTTQNGVDKRSKIRELVSQNGIMAACFDKAKEYVSKAIDALGSYPDSSHKSALIAIAEFVVERKV